MAKVYFGCSSQICSTKRISIEKISINWILPESVAPHLNVQQVGAHLKKCILWNILRVFS
jgi:hypothetical protein